ncbi:hypothetical protein VNO77_27801 [Canavalia gladiata]|uniref:Uncharacterized protein n=1 Tax=Canavalia gladiata TaxID=3824 RepID=A0AAN9KUN8_CANGL
MLHRHHHSGLGMVEKRRHIGFYVGDDGNEFNNQENMVVKVMVGDMTSLLEFEEETLVICVLLNFVEFQVQTLDLLSKSKAYFYDTKGMSGAYSGDASFKAYSKCEIVSCDDFKATFKAQAIGAKPKEKDGETLPVQDGKDELGMMKRHLNMVFIGHIDAGFKQTKGR